MAKGSETLHQRGLRQGEPEERSPLHVIKSTEMQARKRNGKAGRRANAGGKFNTFPID